MRRFEIALPDSLEACQQALADGPDVKLVAGGTDLLPQMKNGLVKARRVVDLSALPELQVVERSEGRRTAHRRRRGGADDRSGASQCATASSALAESAGVVGSLQIRNLATLGGNVCNAAPSADMSRRRWWRWTAECVIAGPHGRRSVPDRRSSSRASAAPCWQPGELLVEIVDSGARARAAAAPTCATRPRRELDIAVVGVASQLTIRDGTCTKARIALGAVAPVIVRATEAEARLEGEAVTPELIERGGPTRGRLRQPDLRPARLGRVSPPPGPSADAPHADRPRSSAPPAARPAETERTERCPRWS